VYYEPRKNWMGGHWYDDYSDAGIPGIHAKLCQNGHRLKRKVRTGTNNVSLLAIPSKLSHCAQDMYYSVRNKQHHLDVITSRLAPNVHLAVPSGMALRCCSAYCSAERTDSRIHMTRLSCFLGHDNCKVPKLATNH
jgi:hypothetical protein